MLKAFIANESGSAAVEYGLIIALVAAVSIATIKSVGTNLSAHWGRVNANIPAAVPAPATGGVGTAGL